MRYDIKNCYIWFYVLVNFYDVIIWCFIKDYLYFFEMINKIFVVLIIYFGVIFFYIF